MSKLPEIGKRYKNLGSNRRMEVRDGDDEDVCFFCYDDAESERSIPHYDFWSEFEELPDQEPTDRKCSKCNKRIQDKDGYSGQSNNDIVTCLPCTYLHQPMPKEPKQVNRLTDIGKTIKGNVDEALEDYKKEFIIFFRSKICMMETTLTERDILTKEFKSFLECSTENLVNALEVIEAWK